MKKFTRFIITINQKGNTYQVPITRDGRHFKLHLIQLIGDRSYPSDFELCFCNEKSLDGRLKKYKKYKKYIFEEFSWRFKKAD